jgi:hypothetical protein
MMKRVWYFLREVAWTAVVSLLLAIGAIVVALLGYDAELVLSLGLGAIALGVISTRA